MSIGTESILKEFSAVPLRSEIEGSSVLQFVKQIKTKVNRVMVILIFNIVKV
tara:strand:+ start:401 stop:556 length:156 start_codon:yes stop_codon:yes gene_type:complete